jgi:hypothetical protein
MAPKGRKRKVTKAEALEAAPVPAAPSEELLEAPQAEAQQVRPEEDGPTADAVELEDNAKTQFQA